MKNLIVLFVIGLLIFSAVYYVTFKTSEDPGQNFGLAFGNADGDAIEMHTVIFGLTIRRDPPRVDLKTGTTYWDEWVQNHFQLTDAAGNPVPLKREMGSSVIQGKDIKAGTPEFFLVAVLKKGAKYDFDFVPYRGSPDVYRYSFTCPSQDETIRRPLFKPKP